MPYLSDDAVTLYHGDAIAVLSQLDAESADLVVTSPPFFGLRDYGTGRWDGGDPDCDHLAPAVGGVRTSGDHFKTTADEARRRIQYGRRCARCGAVRLDEQIGLEDTPDAFVARLVEVFREVRRVLRPHGVLFVEVGDSYASNVPYYAADNLNVEAAAAREKGTRPQASAAGVKPKDLFGVPWTLALALRADGWYLRGEYIWEKPNPMPESVTDRCTRAHSTVFHLTKSARYYWDGEAIREDAAGDGDGRPRTKQRTVRDGVDTHGGSQGNGEMSWPSAGRNARTVWSIPTEPSGLGLCPSCRAFWPRNAPERHCGVEVVQHYAAFPEALAEKAILAASSERGVCPACSAPWRRVVERSDPELAANTWSPNGAADQDVAASAASTLKHVRRSRTVGWEPTCACGLEPTPSVVLDPFSGSGTTIAAARRLGRAGVGVELNEHYCEMTGHRLKVPEVIERGALTSTEPTQLLLT